MKLCTCNVGNFSPKVIRVFISEQQFQFQTIITSEKWIFTLKSAVITEHLVETTAVVGRHPTGIHSCFSVIKCYICYIIRSNLSPEVNLGFSFNLENLEK